MNRRSFLKIASSGIVLSVLPPRVFMPFISMSKVQSGAIRPGWNVTCSLQALASHGTWIAERSLELLVPDAWHAWGLWLYPNYPRRVPVIFNGRWWNRSETLRWMTDHPDAFWLFGNEIERPEQGFEPPHRAAELTGELIAQGLQANTVIRYAAGGNFIGRNEFDGLAWLTQYLIELDARDIPRPDKWSIHSYNSYDIETFRTSWSRWQEWYAIHGEGKPVIMSEGCAHERSVGAQIQIMDELSTLLSDGLESVFWFTAYRLPEDPWRNSALCSIDTSAQTASFTELGRHWKELQLIV